MRVSNSSGQIQLLHDLQARLADLERAQQQATGKRVIQPSDDPSAAAEILRTSSGLAAVEQFRKNAAVVQTSLGAEDAVEKTLGSLLSDAKALAVVAASSAPGDPVRRATC